MPKGKKKTKAFGMSYSLEYKTKKRSYRFIIHTDSTWTILESLFTRWKSLTYLWTPENFGMFLRDHSIDYWIESVLYRNL